MRTQEKRKLHLGCGANLLDGWLNTDLEPRFPSVMRLDATRRFPFSDGSFHRVYSEHMIEHVPYPDGLRMLEECRRVLAPGGRIRVTTPDLRFLLALFDGEPSDLQRRYIAWSLETFMPDAPFAHETFVLNHFVRNWGHAFIYDETVLRDALQRAGFVDVVRRELCDSEDPELRGLEIERRLPSGMLRLESLVLEAAVPVAGR